MGCVKPAISLGGGMAVGGFPESCQKLKLLKFSQPKIGAIVVKNGGNCEFFIHKKMGGVKFPKRKKMGFHHLELYAFLGFLGLEQWGERIRMCPA